MTYDEIVKGLECCSRNSKCEECPYSVMSADCFELEQDATRLIKKQKEEIDNLEYTLIGVMHNVDKWLDEEELELNEVSRAILMRERALQIIEAKDVEIARLKEANAGLALANLFDCQPNEDCMIEA